MKAFVHKSMLEQPGTGQEQLARKRVTGTRLVAEEADAPFTAALPGLAKESPSSLDATRFQGSYI